MNEAAHHFSPFHLGPAGDPGEGTGEDQGRPLNPQALLNMETENRGYAVFYQPHLAAP